jgi:hypothetical protein
MRAKDYEEALNLLGDLKQEQSILIEAESVRNY